MLDTLNLDLIGQLVLEAFLLKTWPYIHKTFVSVAPLIFLILTYGIVIQFVYIY